MKDNDNFVYRFQTISYLIGGVVFSFMGLSGFKQLAYTPEFPGIKMILFTAFLTYFGIWSLRKFYERYRTKKTCSIANG